MRVFVGEYVCGGGFISTEPAAIDTALRSEGSAMLSALVEDLSEFYWVVVAIDPRFDLALPAGVQRVPMQAGPLWRQWVNAASSCDCGIVVAPETNGVLAAAVSVLRSAGVEVPMSSGDFLRVSSDKWEMARALVTSGVAHPLTLLAERCLTAKPLPAGPWMIKPRDGCGGDRVRRFETLDEARAVASAGQLLQRFQPGCPVSLSCLIERGKIDFLPATRQRFDGESYCYQGGQGPLSDQEQARAEVLAGRALAAMPPVARGYVGVDMILGHDAATDCVLEINPRLTTSYVGLRRMVAENLAPRILGQASGAIHCTAPAETVRWQCHP